MKNNLGYACINYGFSQRPLKKRITTNRTMIKRTFQQKGIKYASELALANCKDLIKILKWNVENDINFFRISSSIFPWASEYQLEDLPDYDQIEEELYESALFIANNNLRITSHPGPFNKLTSPDERVVRNTIKDLEIHGKVHDLLYLPKSPFAKINIHVGAAYDDKDMACRNFCNNFKRLSKSVRSRLTVENDDRASLYSTKELYERIYKKIKIPIVFDYHHHKFCSGGQTEYEALEMALSTWEEVIPVCHYSESRAEEYGDPKIKENAHSDSYKRPIEFYSKRFDVMLEAKHKEVALFKMRDLLRQKELLEGQNA